MGDELFLRSRCSGGAGCHCAGMEHFYVPDSTDRTPPTSSRGRRVSGQVGGALNDSMHSIKSSSTRPAPARSAGAAAASQDCTAALLASVFDQVSGAETDDRPARSRRVRRPARERRRQEESQMDTSGLPDLSYLAYSSDEEFEEFMKQPRTDYTYSRSLSYTAVRPEPVGPPSMSRLGLRSPSHGAGDSPLPAARTAPSRADRGAVQAAAGPALPGDERGVYESTTTRVYSYRREITSRVSSNSLMSNASVAPPLSFTYSSSAEVPPPPEPEPSPAPPAVLPAEGGPASSSSVLPRSSPNSAESSRPTPSLEDTLLEELLGDSTLGLSPGLDADSQDEEWLPTDGVSKLGAHRCSTPYKTRPGWSVRRCARQALSPLLRLWLALTAVCHHLWTAVRPLFLAPVSKGVPASGPAPGVSLGLAAGVSVDSARTAVGADSPVVGSVQRKERRNSRPPSRHRYQLRPRLTPQRETPPGEWSDSAAGRRNGGLGVSAGRGEGSTQDGSDSVRPDGGPGRLVTALAWLAAVLWYVNPLRWAAAACSAVISRAQTAAEVLNLPRGAATVAAALNPAAWARTVRRKVTGSSGKLESRPGWLRWAGALLWGSVGTASAAPAPPSAAPGSGSRAELWRRSGSLLAGSGGDSGTGSRAGAGGPSGESWVGGAAVKEAREGGGWRCLPLATAALLLLLLTVLLLLPFLGWLGGEGGESPAELLLPAGRWPLPDTDSVKQYLSEALSSLGGALSFLAGGVSYLLGGILAGLTSMAEGLLTIGIYSLAAVQVAVTQLAGAVGSVGAVLWAPLTSGSALPPPTPAAGTEPSPVPAEVVVPPAAGDAGPAPTDPRLSEVLVQMDELKARLELLQQEYQSCRSAAALPPSAAAVRAALGLPSGSAPLTTDRLEAAEARLRGRLEAELAAVRALLDREDGGRDVEVLLARLTALEEAVPAAQRQRSRLDAEGRAAAARLGSLEQEMGDLRAELAHLQSALSAAREALRRTGSCCNGTAAHWSGTVGAELGRIESQLLDRMQLFTTNFRKDLTADLPSLTGAAAAAAAGGSGGGGGGISREEALAIAQHELALYDADKTGQFDFALESAGGSVLSTKCTEAYTARTARLTVLGVPLWYPSNNPRSIIQPYGRPGECFAFHGEGQFVIGLSRPVRPTEFVIEHIARGLTPGGRIDSAPRHCSVLAVADDGGPATLLASFEYSAAGPPLQRFAAAPTDRPVSAVELRVTSNWGHPEYTCLYRFRVHGQPEGDAR
ncbi:uncharacterized protein LOC122363925 isoform X1 [Amphibalanus amphitrite]|uniref:uncharacterized protein LOC122363925 isoform X1 n=1 Tax=Amphibalanus amphitrite TaxID=1232801 RepID=UPI001C90952B|nr:uncharacterized protein LOC122363925 isoform X1 [Amphibalanus amphitrite]